MKLPNWFLAGVLVIWVVWVGLWWMKPVVYPSPYHVGWVTDQNKVYLLAGYESETPLYFDRHLKAQGDMAMAPAEEPCTVLPNENTGKSRMDQLLEITRERKPVP